MRSGIPSCPTLPNVRRSTVYERNRTTRRLLEAVLKWVGVTLLLVSCALLVYLAAVLFARLSAGAFFP
jgi:membrane protein required for beta-lactamase induction